MLGKLNIQVSCQWYKPLNKVLNFTALVAETYYPCNKPASQ